MILIFDDELTRPDSRQRLYFINRALLEKVILLKFLDWDDLDRELAHFLCIQCSIHLAVVALAYLLD